jgi:hypothetical protein
MSNNPTGFQSFSQLTNGSVSLDQADPVQACLPGSFFDTGNNPQRVVKGLCDTFMAQRCASDYDQACNIFAISKKNQDFTGSAYRNWLQKSLESMFCRPADEGYCVERCQQFNPQAPASAQVCETVGNVVYRDSSKLYDLSGNVVYLGRLETPSPLKIADCPKVCDVFDLAKLTDDNFILNECLDMGVGLEIIQNLAQNLVSNQVPIANTRLQTYINQYMQNGTVKPGFASVGSNAPVISTIPTLNPALNNYLAPNQTYQVGGSNLNQNVVQPKEGFHYRRRSSLNKAFGTILLLVAIAAIGYVGYKYYKQQPKTKFAIHYKEW